jgi:hypothetical protein
VRHERADHEEERDPGRDGEGREAPRLALPELGADRQREEEELDGERDDQESAEALADREARADEG